MVKSHIGGAEVTSYLIRLLTLEGLGPFESISEKQVAKTIKEQYSFISPSPNSGTLTLSLNSSPLVAPGTVDHVLPDGREISIPSEPLGRCGEIFFNPALIGLSAGLALPNLIKQAVQATNEEARPILVANILLCGGTVRSFTCYHQFTLRPNLEG